VGAMYFEDFTVGAKFVSPGRTVGEADIANFAGVSGDFQPLHTDAEYAKTTPYGQRIAHGLLGTVMASGLVLRSELGLATQSTLLALLGLEWKYHLPILIGDTIHIESEVIATRETSKPDRGIVTFRRDVVNQRGEVVQVGTLPLMIRRRPAAG
jgi:acyl dehydratase